MPVAVFVSGSLPNGGSATANISNSVNPYHFHHAGTAWTFTAEQTGSNYLWHAWKSINNGATWVESDAGNGPTVRLGSAFYWDGASNTVWILKVAQTGTDGGGHPLCQLQLMTFSLATGTFGATIGPLSPVQRTTPGDVYLVRFSDNTFRVYYPEGFGGASNKIWLQDFDGVATWSNETTILDSGARSCQLRQFLFGSDVGHLIYRRLSPDEYTYIQIARNAAVSSLHLFTDLGSGGSFGSAAGSTSCDGLLEVDKNTIVYPATVVVGPGNVEMAVYRGTPISNPTWTQELTNTLAGNNDALPQYATLVRLASGAEMIYWAGEADLVNFAFSATSAIYSQTNLLGGAGWTARTLVYSIQSNPVSDPDSNNCKADLIYSVSVEDFGGAQYVHFDVYSSNFSQALLREPNFTFAGPAPSPPPAPPIAGTTPAVLQFVPFGGNGGYPGTVSGHGNVYTTPANPDGSPVLMTDDDYGQISPYYVTYFFVNHEQEMALQLGAHRKMISYILASLSGTGNMTITALINVLANAWPINVTRALASQAIIETEWSGASATGNRIALKFASSPTSGTDNAFLLEKVAPAMKPVTHLPVRGSSS